MHMHEIARGSGALQSGEGVQRHVVEWAGEVKKGGAQRAYCCSEFYTQAYN